MAVVFDAPGPTFRKELYGGVQGDARRAARGPDRPVPGRARDRRGVGHPDPRGAGLRGRRRDREPRRTRARGRRGGDRLHGPRPHAARHASASCCSTRCATAAIGPAEVEARFGVPPAQVLDVRALVGDTHRQHPGREGHRREGRGEARAGVGEPRGACSTHASRGRRTSARARRSRRRRTAARLSKRLATLRSDAPGCGDPAALRAARARSRAAARALRAPRAAAAARDARRRGPARGGAQGALAFDAPAERAPAEPAAPRRARRRRSRSSRVARSARPRRPRARARVAAALRASPSSACRGRAACRRSRRASPSRRRRGRAHYVPLGARARRGGARRGARRRRSAGTAPRRWIVAREQARADPASPSAASAPRCPPSTSSSPPSCSTPPAQHGTPALAAQQLGPARRALRGARRAAARRRSAAGRAARASRPPPGPAPRPARSSPSRARSRRASSATACARSSRTSSSRSPRCSRRWSARACASTRRRSSGSPRSSARELERLEARIYELAGERFQIGSPKQLQAILFEKLGLPVGEEDEDRLLHRRERARAARRRTHELPAYVLAHRRLAKLRSTYVDALPPLVNPRTGRIHPTFHQTGAATGRLSSSNPNVQNIPIRSESGVRIREAFVPAEGHRLLSADYSQVELRILAHYSGDESLRRGLPHRRRHPPPHRRRGGAASRPTAVTDEPARARQGGELRDHLRPLGLRAGEPARHRDRRGAGHHRRLLRALRRGASLPRRDDPRRRAPTASCARCSAGGATCRTSARATACSARRPSAWR